MIKYFSFLSLLFLAITATAQPYTGGRLQDMRFNASIGIFSASGVGDYQGAIGVVGSTGYDVDSIQVGDLLLDDANLYRVEAVSVSVPGSVATIDVTFLQGTVGNPAPPQSGRGMVIRPTSNLGLLLLTENGSNFITEEQEAKATTHNFLVIDQLLGNLDTAGDTIYIESPDSTYAVTAGDTVALPGAPRRYDAGNGCWVYATAPGVSYVKSAGQGTLTVPEGIELYSFRIVGGAAELNSGEVSITIVYDPTVGHNKSNATLWHPDITIQNRTTVLPSDPYLQRPDDAGDSINIFDEKITTPGQVTTKITGLSGDWGVKGTM